MKRCFFIWACLLLASTALQAQARHGGKLFIIGGGTRTPALVRQMLATANLTYEDYIVVLPMASAEPDSSYFYFKQDVAPLYPNTIANLNFTADKTASRAWLDSLKHAKLIFITGGDQLRFMAAVLHTPVYTAIRTAFNNGATIAGTSAGAAVMPRYMITGKELLGDTAYNETFRKIIAGNIDIQQGLGLVDSVVIDQHFIKRSRYNRLISALAKYPQYPCIGIDESTAIIVQGKKITVAGEGQVVVMSHPQDLAINAKGQIKWSGVKMQILTAGDVFWR
jgi:cyanophycinase